MMGRFFITLLWVLSASVPLFLAIYMPESLAPDEYMRNDIPFWIFQNKTLPVGSEPELTYSVWRFSYGFLPYLPSLLALPLMKLFSLFNSTDETLFLATRIVSVLTYLALGIVCWTIAKPLFNRLILRVLFVVGCIAIPQVVFVSAYHNNDGFALLTCFLILYFLLRAKKEQWNISSCIGLGWSISMCMLTYYNALGWVLVAVIYSFHNVCTNSNIEHKIRFVITRCILITSLVCVLAGWFFIRNAIIHDGDFLGIHSQLQCAEMYRAMGLPTHTAMGALALGRTIYEMLFSMSWLKITLESFFGIFGNMNIPMSPKIYQVYFWIFGMGFVFGCVYFLKKRKFLELGLLLLAIAIPVLLSAYRSYTYDFQPQGRYIFPALPSLLIIMTYGWAYVDDLFSNIFRTFRSSQFDYLLEGSISLSVTATLVMVYIYVFFKIMKPGLMVIS